MVFSPNCRNKKLQCYDRWQNFFDQPVKNSLRTYDCIRKIAKSEEDDYTDGRLLDYNYLKDYSEMIATNLSKEQALDADTNAIQQIFFGDLKNNGTIFIVIERNNFILH